MFPDSSKHKDSGPKRPATSEPDWRGFGTILVVDDEEPVRLFAALAVARFGFKVLQAADGKEALEILARNAQEISPGTEESIVCVILDLLMPRMGGADALREVRKLFPSLPVIISSGFCTEEVTGQFPKLTGVHFLQKPYQMNVLSEKLRELLPGD